LQVLAVARGIRLILARWALMAFEERTTRSRFLRVVSAVSRERGSGWDRFGAVAIPKHK
jgi:hypothetical protein